MKEFIVFLFLIHACLQASYSIVFVHIGGEVPAHFHVSAEQARLFNPDADIYLIANRVALDKLPQKILQIVQTVPCESLKKSKEHAWFLKNFQLDAKFWNGFWRFTSERFFYLDSFLAREDLKDVFHLENDVMLYVNLEELLPIFRAHYSGIAATFDNDERCIPGFLYIANASSVHQLATQIAGYAKHGYLDMQVIAKIKSKFGKSLIDTLPIIPEAYAKNNVLVSTIGFLGKNSSEYYNHVDAFESIFDAAALGQYLGGGDGRLIDPVPGFINESCIFNPALFQFEWHLDSQGRKIPYALYEGHKFRINNLHIHSKHLEQFAS